MKSGGYIELRFGPRWKYISAVRSFIQNFLVVGLEDTQKASTIAMAVSELLENAVKYANGEDTHIRLEVKPDGSHIALHVENSAAPENISVLKEVFDQVTNGDPFQIYIEAMKKAATRTDGKSRLGLVRIRYETGGKLKFSLLPENRVRITLEV